MSRNDRSFVLVLTFVVFFFFLFAIDGDICPQSMTDRHVFFFTGAMLLGTSEVMGHVEYSHVGI